MASREIPLFKVYMNPEASKSVGEVLESGYIGQGPKVEEFEDKLKIDFGYNLLVTTNSATSADHLALHLLKAPANSWPGIIDGDEVLATSITCTASNWPIINNGMRIKWVDVDPKTFNMDLDDLAKKISPTTKVILFTHWGGYPVDLDRVREIQDQAFELYGFRPAVIEDCAHAFGSTYKGKRLGNHGNIAFYSFQAIKHITSVDGGALFLPHQNLYQRAKLLRWYGISREGRAAFRCEEPIDEVGFKFHMNDVSATVGLANLAHSHTIVDIHKSNGNFYNEALKGVGGVTLLENAPDRESSFWIYSMKVERQEDFTRYMAENGVTVSRVHERNDKHPAVSEFQTILPNTDWLVKEMISIPCGWWVTTEDREYIVDLILAGW